MKALLFGFAVVAASFLVAMVPQSFVVAPTAEVVAQAKPVDPPKPDPPKKFKTGAKRTSAATIAKAISEGSLKVYRHDGPKAPAQFAMVPKQMSYWLNDQEGDCVSASEAAQIAAYSTAVGTEYFIKDATVQAFCSKYGTCNGAELLPVIQQMQSDGMHQGADTIQDGVSSVVNFAVETELQAALSQGPVKIGIDASALPSGAGNNQGWSAFGGSPGQFTNEDHCVELFGYGPVTWLCQQLGTPVPAGAPVNGYLLYTWSTIGVVDHAWIMSTVGEAYLRGPVIINGKALPPLGPAPIPPVPPTPPTPPVPPPNPPVPTPGVVTSATLLFADGSTQTLINQAAQRSVVSLTYSDGTVQPVGIKAVTYSDGSTQSVVKDAAPAKQAPVAAPVYYYTTPADAFSAGSCGPAGCAPARGGLFWRFRR